MKPSADLGRFGISAAVCLFACLKLAADHASPDAPIDDRDRDGLTDVEEAAAGTLPNLPDFDGDGLLDGWEVKGIAGPDGIEPLPVWDSKPARKDVFVEIDWMLDSGGSPQPNAIIAYQAAVDVIRVFRRSGSGIEIHFDLGPRIEELVPESILESDMDFSAFRSEPDAYKTLPYQDRFPPRPECGEMGASTLLSLYDVYFGGKYFRPSRRNVFYYVVIAEQSEPPNGQNPGGSRNHPYTESFSDDLARRDGLTSSGVQICVIFRKPVFDLPPTLLRYHYSATLLHELGHAFGLGHGGAKPDMQWDNTNWKPNYPSVMNYRFQACGVDISEGKPVMDFSHGALTTMLREKVLLEPIGMGKRPNEHILSCVGVGPLNVPAFPHNLDWNKDGFISDEAVTRDLNENGRLDDLPLTDHDDWSKFRREGFDGIGLKAYRGCGWDCSRGAEVVRVLGDFNGDRLTDLFLALGDQAAWAYSNGKRQLAILEPPAGNLPAPWAIRPRETCFAGDFFAVGRDLLFVARDKEAAVFDSRDGEPVWLWHEDSVIAGHPAGAVEGWNLSSSDRFLPLKFHDSDRTDVAVTNGNSLAILSSTLSTQEPGSPPRLLTCWREDASIRAWTNGRAPALRPGRTFPSGRQSLFVTSTSSLTEILPPAEARLPNVDPVVRVLQITLDGIIPAQAAASTGWAFSDSDCLHTTDLDGDGIEELVLRAPLRLGVVRWNGDGEAFVVWSAVGSIQNGEWPLSRDTGGDQLRSGQLVPGGGHELVLSNGQSLATLGWVPEEGRLDLLGVNNRYILGPSPRWEILSRQTMLLDRFLPGESDTLLLYSGTGLLLARFEAGAFHAVSRAEGLVGAWLFDQDDILTPVQIDSDPELEILARNGARLGLLELAPVRTSTFLSELDMDRFEFHSIPVFRRGDINSDGELDVSDVVMVLGYLFLGFDTPACLDATDVDDDGILDLSDPIYLLSFLFTGGEPPPPPGPMLPGIDPTDDRLGCDG